MNKMPMHKGSQAVSATHWWAITCRKPKGKKIRKPIAFWLIDGELITAVSFDGDIPYKVRADEETTVQFVYDPDYRAKKRDSKW